LIQTLNDGGWVQELDDGGWIRELDDGGLGTGTGWWLIDTGTG